jgi:GT2 family glycosyltransferase
VGPAGRIWLGLGSVERATRRRELWLDLFSNAETEPGHPTNLWNQYSRSRCLPGEGMGSHARAGKAPSVLATLRGKSRLELLKKRYQLKLILRLLRHLRVHGLFSTLQALSTKLFIYSGLRYQWWIWKVEPRHRVSGVKLPPGQEIAVVVPVHDPKPKYLQKTLQSLKQQSHPAAQIILVDDQSKSPLILSLLRRFANQESHAHLLELPTNQGVVAALNAGLDRVECPWVAFVDHDDELPTDALARITQAITDHPDGQLFYTDEDQLNRWGWRCNPFFKPDWDELRFWGQNYLNHLVVSRTQLVQRVGGFREGFDGSQDYDLWLRLLQEPEVSPQSVIHVLGIGYHWRQQPRQLSQRKHAECAQTGVQAVQDHLLAREITARVEPLTQEPTWHSIQFHQKDQSPRVTAIVPTRDRLDLLLVCLQGLLKKTDYPNLEILIVDNDSKEVITLNWLTELDLQESRVRILQHPGDFNYSLINNRAVQATDSELILLLNNDIRVLTPGWLQQMVSTIALPGVGAVGAKLLYPDGTLQHAGVIFGLGPDEIAGHDGTRKSVDQLKPFGAYHLLRQTSAVTAACMLVRRTAWETVGGLTSSLPIAFNDVDFCMKLRAAGWQIAWNPNACLEHQESATRGHDELDPSKRARLRQDAEQMKQRWGKMLQNDPYYHPWLSSKMSELHQLELKPRIF